MDYDFFTYMEHHPTNKLRVGTYFLAKRFGYSIFFLGTSPRAFLSQGIILNTIMSVFFLAANAQIYILFFAKLQLLLASKSFLNKTNVFLKKIENATITNANIINQEYQTLKTYSQRLNEFISPIGIFYCLNIITSLPIHWEILNSKFFPHIEKLMAVYTLVTDCLCLFICGRIEYQVSISKPPLLNYINKNINMNNIKVVFIILASIIWYIRILHEAISAHIKVHRLLILFIDFVMKWVFEIRSHIL